MLAKLNMKFNLLNEMNNSDVWMIFATMICEIVMYNKFTKCLTVSSLGMKITLGIIVSS